MMHWHTHLVHDPIMRLRILQKLDDMNDLSCAKLSVVMILMCTCVCVHILCTVNIVIMLLDLTYSTLYNFRDYRILFAIVSCFYMVCTFTAHFGKCIHAYYFMHNEKLHTVHCMCTSYCSVHVRCTFWQIHTCIFYAYWKIAHCT